MSRYKDRYGHPIKLGDVVAQAITLHTGAYKGFSFSTRIVKKHGPSYILDGVHGYGYLAEQDPQTLVVIRPDTDLRQVECEFIMDFPRRY